MRWRKKCPVGLSILPLRLVRLPDPELQPMICRECFQLAPCTPHPDGQAGFRAVCPTHGEIYVYFDGGTLDMGLELAGVIGDAVVFVPAEDES